MNRAELEQLDRDALVARAEEAGVSRARILTRPELVDELLLRSAVDQATKQRSRGLFGRARDLLARVVERGLHLPDAADRIRSLGEPILNRPSAPAALPTVTLAEIYAAQGHRTLAVETLERVLAQEPEHLVASTLLDRLSDANYPVTAPRLPPEDDEPPLGGAQERDAGADGERTSGGGDSPQAQSPLGAFFEPPEPSGEAPEVTELPAAVIAPGAEPMHMLDDAPLPLLYDVDECVAMPVDPTTLYVYWEIRRRTLEHVRAARSDATVALRVVAVVPTWDGPRSTLRDHEVVAALGDFFVRDLPGGSIVRVAIGLRDAGGFEPIAHCPSLDMPSGAPWPVVADTLLRWAPDGAVAPMQGEQLASEPMVRLVRGEALPLEHPRRVATPPMGASESWRAEERRTP